MASAQVLQKRDITEIDSLAALVEPTWVNKGLAFFWERYGDSTKRLAEFASTMHSIAKNWVHPGAAVLEELSTLCKKAWPEESPGFSQKNIETLLQFDTSDRVRDLYTLPYVIGNEIRAKKKISEEDARLMIGALAIELAETSLVRIENLASIDIFANVKTIGAGKNAERFLVFPSEVVKNGKDLQFPLPSSTWRLWDFYIEKCRPKLISNSTTRLFPIGIDPKTRRSRLRHLMTNIVKRRIGLDVTPHQYRHIGVMLYLRHHPGDYETCRIMLGHKSDRTLKKFYAWLEEKGAVKRFADVVLGGRTDWLDELGF